MSLVHDSQNRMLTKAAMKGTLSRSKVASNRLDSDYSIDKNIKFEGFGTVK
jgi:hypothetical protein